MNIEQTTRQIIQKLNSIGSFLDISIEVSPAFEGYWHEHYSTFTIDIIDFNIMQDDSEFDEEYFWEEMRKFIKQEFGSNSENITIDIYSGSNSLEIYPTEKYFKSIS